MVLSAESVSVHAHLGFLQGIISRMAGNSAAAKTWCVTLLTAIAALALGSKEEHLLWVGMLPLLMFLLLDAYYLSLERIFRRKYESFVQKLHRQELSDGDLFDLVPPQRGWFRLPQVLACIPSPSILPFYSVLAASLVALGALT